jgi:hypothetical protein
MLGLNQKLALIVKTFAVAAMVLSSLAVSSPIHAAEDEPLFQLLCGIDHFGADDPIVFPGQPGASHMHSFYGNPTTNAATTTSSLQASASTCGRDMGTSDRSAYWIPSLMNGQTVVKNDSQAMFIYYKRAGGSSGPQVKPFPAGFRMIAGNAHATTPQSQSVISWSCGGGGPETPGIPKCSDPKQPIHATLTFPNCWDGKNLDSADHMSHMAYSNTQTGACPATHPVSLARIEYEVDYPGITGGPNYSFSSGGIYSFHGDFFAAWDSQVQNALVTYCLNGSHQCFDVNRKGNTLTYAKPGAAPTSINLANYTATTQTFPEPTPAKATPKPTTTPKPSPAKTPSPTPTPAGAVLGDETTTPTAAALPETGMGVVGGALGLSMIVFFAIKYRFSRRSMMEALRRSGRP